MTLTIQARVMAAVHQIAGGQSGLTEDTELLESGILDSLSVMRLITQVEGEFNLKLPLIDLSVENLATPRALADLVETKL